MFTRSFFLSTVCCFLISAAQSQERLATYQLSPEELSSRDVKMFFDDQGNLLADIVSYAGNSRLLFKEGEKPQVLYDEKEQDNKSSSAKTVKQVRGYKRLATLFQKASYYDCYYSSKKSAFYFTSLDSSGRSIVTDTVKLKPTETVAAAVEDNGAIYVLTYVENSSLLNIYAKSPGKQLASIEKAISVNVSAPGDRKEKSNFSEFFEGKKEKAYILYDNSHPNPAYLSVMQRKIYHTAGKLILSLENYMSETRLVVITLYDFTATFLKVQPSFSHIPDKYKGLPANSSVVSGDFLFKSGNYNDTFFISATNITTGALAYNFVVNTSNPSLVIKTPFFDSANYIGLTEYRKKRLGIYLKSSGIGVTNAGNNLYGIEIFGQNEWEISSLINGILAVGAFPRVDFTNAILYTFRDRSQQQEGTLTIRNIFDSDSGKFVPENIAMSLFDNWASMLELAKDLMSKYTYSEDRPKMVVSGERVYAYLIEPSTGHLIVYNF